MSKISGLPALVTPADGDLLEIVDIDDTTQAPTGTNKKVSKADLVASAPPAAHAVEHEILLIFPAPTTLGNGNFVFFDIVDTPSGAFTKIYNAGPILPAKIVQIGKEPEFDPGCFVFTL